MNTPGHQLYTFPDLDEAHLERRIREESGPVKVYQAIEWFERLKSVYAGRSTPFVCVERRGVRLNAAAYRAIGQPQYVQFGWDNLRGGLLIAPSRGKDSRSYSISMARPTTTIGGTTLARRIAERLPFGKYEAVVEDGRLFVRSPEAGEKR